MIMAIFIVLVMILLVLALGRRVFWWMIAGIILLPFLMVGCTPETVPPELEFCVTAVEQMVKTTNPEIKVTRRAVIAQCREGQKVASKWLENLTKEERDETPSHVECSPFIPKGERCIEGAVRGVDGSAWGDWKHYPGNMNPRVSREW
jgi:hypothetical protein